MDKSFLNPIRRWIWVGPKLFSAQSWSWAEVSLIQLEGRNCARIFDKREFSVLRDCNWLLLVICARSRFYIRIHQDRIILCKSNPEEVYRGQKQATFQSNIVKRYHAAVFIPFTLVTRSRSDFFYDKELQGEISFWKQRLLFIFGHQ